MAPVVERPPWRTDEPPERERSFNVAEREKRCRIVRRDIKRLSQLAVRTTNKDLGNKGCGANTSAQERQERRALLFRDTQEKRAASRLRCRPGCIPKTPRGPSIIRDNASPGVARALDWTPDAQSIQPPPCKTIACRPGPPGARPIPSVCAPKMDMCGKFPVLRDRRGNSVARALDWSPEASCCNSPQQASYVGCPISLGGTAIPLQPPPPPAPPPPPPPPPGPPLCPPHLTAVASQPLSACFCTDAPGVAAPAPAVAVHALAPPPPCAPSPADAFVAVENGGAFMPYCQARQEQFRSCPVVFCNANPPPSLQNQSRSCFVCEAKSLSTPKMMVDPSRDRNVLLDYMQCCCQGGKVLETPPPPNCPNQECPTSNLFTNQNCGQVEPPSFCYCYDPCAEGAIPEKCPNSYVPPPGSIIPTPCYCQESPCRCHYYQTGVRREAAPSNTPRVAGPCVPMLAKQCPMCGVCSESPPTHLHLQLNLPLSLLSGRQAVSGWNVPALGSSQQFPIPLTVQLQPSPMPNTPAYCPQ